MRSAPVGARRLPGFAKTLRRGKRRLASTRLRASRSGGQTRAPARAAPACIPIKASGSSLSRPLLPATRYAPPPREARGKPVAGNRTVFMRSSRPPRRLGVGTRRGTHRFAVPPRRRIKTSSAPAPRPARAKRSAPLRSAPPNPPQSCGGGRVGPRPAAAVHVLARSRPSVDPPSQSFGGQAPLRGDGSPPPDCAAALRLRRNPEEPPRFTTAR